MHDVIYVNIALTGIVSALMQGKGQTALGHAFNNALHRDFFRIYQKNGFMEKELLLDC